MDIGKKQWACVKFEIESSDETMRILELNHSYFDYNNAPDVSEHCELIIIDVPIGLLEDEDGARTDKGRSGDRSADRGARKWCRSSSSVFPPPTTGQLSTGLAEHRRARSATEKANRKLKLANVSPQGLSQQSLQLLPAIESAAALQKKYPGRIFESHPEAVFSSMAGGILPVGKMSLSGALVRAALLSNRLGRDCLRWVLDVESETRVAADNWLDALALAAVALDWLKVDQR